MIQLHTFGALNLGKDGVELRSVLSQPKRAALLVYIAVGSPSGFVSRDTLLGLFWPESDDQRARNALRQALHHLRRSLGEGAIVGRGERELGIDPTLLWCDALAFKAALSNGQLESALELYRGDFLPGLYIDDAPALERVIDSLRSEFARDALAAALEQVERNERADEVRAAAIWARRATAIAPYNEAVVRRLMTILERCGEMAAVGEAYREFEVRLRAELDLSPSAETIALAESIRNRAGRARQATAVTAPEVSPETKLTPGTANEVQAPLYAEIFPSTSSIQTGKASATAATAAADASAKTKTPAPRNERGAFARWRIGAPLAIAAAIVALVLMLPGAPRRTRDSSKASDSRAIAVLPFTNMTGDASNDPFADGISEELLNVLTRIPELKVAARTSSFAFRGHSPSIDSVAKVLGVTHVLEGSVRGAGDRVRITAQLIEARTGFHVWSDTYDRKVKDVLDVQDEISRAIVKALELQLRNPFWGEDSETDDPEAYRLLVRALQLFRAPGRENYAEAATLLDEAIRRDPEYARAYGALAYVRVWQANFHYLPPDSAFALARTLAEKSVTLRETPEAHLALARLAEVQEWQPAIADEHMRRALELNPGDARVIQFRGMLLVRMGRVDEGLALLRRATELDPLHPGAFSNLGAMLARVDRMQEALAAFNRALELSPEDPIVLQNLANIHAELGNHALALDALNRALVRIPDDVNLKGLRAYVQVRSKQRAEAIKSLKELEAIKEFPRFRLATLYAHLDAGSTSAASIDRILTLLEQSATRREDDIAGLPSSEDFRSLRTHPRMLKLIEQMKAADQATPARQD